MKTSLTTLVAMAVLVLAVQPARLHSQAALDLRLTPTVAVTGPVGTWHQLQYSEDLGAPTGWTPLLNLLLDVSPKVFFDTNTFGARRYYRSLQLTNVADTNLVWIPAGTFLMGSPNDELGRSPWEGPQTLVTLTDGFFMGRFEVTQGEYASVTGTNPSFWTFARNPTADFLNHLSFPVERVTWNEITNYCRLLTIRDLAAFRIPPGWAYRIPTEAEWEYACRAGSTTPFHYGNALYASTNLGSLANFDGTRPYPSPTNDLLGIRVNHPIQGGAYPPNAFGLHDMHGNVEEFCADRGSFPIPPYAGGAVTNPVSPLTVGFYALRGGKYASSASECRSAQRGIGGNATSGTGFRAVLAPSNNP